MEEELAQRVREALETPIQERRQRQQATHRQQRTLEDLEKLNSHIQLDVAPEERGDYVRQQRWKVVIIS